MQITQLPPGNLGLQIDHAYTIAIDLYLPQKNIRAPCGVGIGPMSEEWCVHTREKNETKKRPHERTKQNGEEEEKK